jgi:hypothetical protein
MKHFYSHALMLLVQLPDEGPSDLIRQNKIDASRMDRHISRSDLNVQQRPSHQEQGKADFFQPLPQFFLARESSQC